MRRNILAAGAALLVLGLVTGASSPVTLIATVPVAVVNIILGLGTSASPGLETQPESGRIRLAMDRGVVRATIYQVVFLDSKLVLKRLSSARVTIILPLMLAILGFEILFIVGALMGGITGFSLQEFLTQRKRNKIESEMQLSSVGKGDIEISYGDLLEVKLAKSRLYLVKDTYLLSVGFPGRYSQEMRPILANIFKSKFKTTESVRTTEASEKENEESQHPRSDRGKFPCR